MAYEGTGVRFKGLAKRLRIALMKRFRFSARRVEGIALYAQGMEDMYLLRVLGPSKKGVYVDVGANDGVFVSNTYALYRLGWRGVCVEPNPVAYSALRIARPEDTCVNVAVGATEGQIELSWRGDITEGSVVGRFADTDNVCTVPQTTLASIFRSCNVPAEFDLLSLDVEGMEEEVLRGVDWESHSPRIVILEYNSEGRVRSDAFDYLYGLGFRPILVNRWNVMFSRCWAEDLLKVHRGQEWFSLDAIRL